MFLQLFISVKRNRKGGKGREAGKANANLHVSQAQDANEVEPHAYLHLQPPYDGHGKGGEEDVGEDVERRVEQGEDDEEVNGVAGGADAVVPVAPHGVAVQEEGHHAEEAVGADEDEGGPEGARVPPARAEAHEVEGDGALEEGDAEGGGYDGLPEGALLDGLQLVLVQDVDVAAQAVYALDYEDYVAAEGA